VNYKFQPAGEHAYRRRVERPRGARADLKASASCAYSCARFLAFRSVAGAAFAADVPARTVQQTTRERRAGRCRETGRSSSCAADRRLLGTRARDRCDGGIEQALSADANPKVATEEIPQGTRVSARATCLRFSSRRSTSTSQAGETTQLIAQAAAQRLEMAIGERREQQTPSYLAGRRVSPPGDATLRRSFVADLPHQRMGWAAPVGERGRPLAESCTVGGLRCSTPGHVFVLTRRTLTLVAWSIASSSQRLAEFVHCALPYTPTVG
jgi:hypothetical protein